MDANQFIYNDDIDTFSNKFSSDRFANAFTNQAHGTSPGSTGSPQSSPHADGKARRSNSTQSPNPQSSPHSQGNTSAQAPFTTSAASQSLNPRSCVTCRKRKVKCDKRQPCSNCSKAHIDCIFPRPGRAPRRAKKPPDAELLARLRRLEGVVQKLGRGEDGEDGPSPEAGSPDTGEAKDTRELPRLDVQGEGSSKQEKLKGLGGTLRIEKEMGNLNIGEGRSRYVSNTFWASLTEEVDEMKDILGNASEFSDPEDDDNNPEPGQENNPTAGRHTHQEFIFGYNSTMINLRILHPPANQTMTYWGLYVENIDPVVRLLHKPTAQKLFIQTSKDQLALSKGTECLAFAVYFAVVTSLTNDQCQKLLGLEREIGLKRYRYATEQALAKANFLTTQELVVVQAFCLFLSCVRRHDNTKCVWTLTGLLTRMAVSIGLHRDGSQFDLPPFQTEMRRRLWWQVCTLDVRASEDQGADPMVVASFFDTKMPLNVNDTDLWPEMTESPEEHIEATEMTFDLVRYEIGGTIRALSQNQTASKLPDDAYQTLEAKEALLERLRLRLEDKYLRHCDMSVPLQWVAANVSRLVMAKIWLVIHHPFRKSGTTISQETRDRTFLTSVDVIRYSRMLETQQKTSKWGWLFRTYFQWHAVAFLLSELCVRRSGTAVDEAWEVLGEAFPDWNDSVAVHKRSMLWRPIVKLLRRARIVRIHELESRKRYPKDGSLGPSSAEQNAPRSPQLAPGIRLADKSLSDAIVPDVPNTPITTILENTSVQVQQQNQAHQQYNSSVSKDTPPSITSQQTTPSTQMDSSNNSVPQAQPQGNHFSFDPTLFDMNMENMDNMDMWLDDPTYAENVDFPEMDWANFNPGQFDGPLPGDFAQFQQESVNITSAAMWGDGKGML